MSSPSIALALTAFAWCVVEDPPAPVPGERSKAEWLIELREGDVAARRRAIYALWKLGPTAVAGDPQGIRAVADALTDEEDYVADVAGRVLRRSGIAASAAADRIGDALSDPRPVVRRHAIAILAGFSNMARDAAPQVIEALRTDEDEAVRAQAAWVLGACGYDLAPVEFGGQVVAALRDALADDAAPVRENAALALTAYGARAAAAIPELERAVREDPEAGPRSRALDALASLGSAARESVPAVAASLADPAAAVRASALGALHAIEPSHAGLDPALRAGLRDTSLAALRVRAAAIVGARKSLDAGLDEALRGALSDRDPTVREAAASAFAEKKPPSAATMDALVAALRDPVQGVRFRAAQALASYDASAARAVPRLVDAVSSRDLLERHMAIIALGRIGPASREAAPVLRRLMEGAGAWSVGLRPVAALALWRIGGEDRPAAKATLVGMLQEPAQWVYAVGALEALGPDAPEAVPGLVRWLREGEPRFRARVATALGAIGPAAESAIPALEEARTDARDPALPAAAREALRRIRGEAAGAKEGN